MPPLTLEGKNLGERRKCYNIKVNEAIKNKTTLETAVAEYGDTDLDQLFKIDVASNYRNVDYIIKILKSEDMLHVSRAIKKSTWLITDSQYAHIINPQYLHSELFPEMTSKAVCKLLLHIRLHLKDERRIEEFFKYYENKDFEKAKKYLPNCSSSFIKEYFSKSKNEIHDIKLFKKLCKKCPSVLEQLLTLNRYSYSDNYSKQALFLLRTDTNRYLDAIEQIEHYLWPQFGKKHTAIIMKKCPERILKNPKKYLNYVHKATVAKYLGAAKIKDFILELSKNKDMQYWVTYRNIKPFIHVMPKEGKFDYLKKVFIDGIDPRSGTGDEILSDMNLSSNENPQQTSNIYQWYEYAPFEIAFTDLKKMIKTESAPNERAAMLKVMLTTTRHNMKHIQDVLQYYHERHINEALKFKLGFINAVLYKTKTHAYNEKCWKIFNEILHSAEVYIESNNGVQTCLEAVIVYNLLHKQPIPDIIVKKFNYNTMTYLKKKLNAQERSLVFEFLYNYIEEKLKNTKNDDQAGVNKAVNLFIQLMDLLLDWDKELEDYPSVLLKIRELITLKQDKKMDINLDTIYNKKSSWKKYMFEESIQLCNSEKVFINALKHDPTLFQRHSKQVEAINFDDKIDLLHFLSKLKVYWPQTLAEEWTNSYKNHIDQTEGYKAITRGFCMLLSRTELLELFEKYAPKEPKIIWSEIDETLLAKRKNFAQLMYLCRPQPPPAAILSYLQGDYLQFALSSLNSILYNLPPTKCGECLPLLLSGPVSVQKQGIRVAFTKFEANKIQEVALKIWKTTKNATIRAVIFQLTFKLLCKKGQTNVEDIWQLLNKFIDNLSTEENPIIYSTFRSHDKVPESVRGKFCVKGYRFLKTLPAKANCQSIIENIAVATQGLMDSIDIAFVEDILLEFIETSFIKKKKVKRNVYIRSMSSVIWAYILNTTDEIEQQRRYEKVIKPWLQAMFLVWDHKEMDVLIPVYFKECLENLTCAVRDNLCYNKYVVPLKVLKNMRNEIQSNLQFVKNYHYVTVLKFVVAFIESYIQIKSELSDNCDVESKNKRLEQVITKIYPLFAAHIAQLLKCDIEEHFPSILTVFRSIFELFYSCINYNNEFVFEKELLKEESFIEVHLLVVYILPQYCYDDPEKIKNWNEVRRKLENHDSEVVRLHYREKFYENPIVDPSDD